MLQVIGEIRPYLEAIYFFSGLLVAGGLVFSLKQLSLIKSDIIIRNERLSKEKAVEACIRYFERYVPLDKKRYQIRRQQKMIGGYKGPIGDFTKASIPSEHLILSINRAEPDAWLDAQNELEAISAFFSTGVADERTGFNVIGRTFCKTVEHNYDLIALCRDDHAMSYWQNTVNLYSIWRPRLSKAEMMSLTDNLQSKIALLGPDVGIPPIGRGRV
jgi:hypothetical protein